jgi:hypothetical protein
MSEIKNITIAYNPNDFFYINANTSEDEKFFEKYPSYCETKLNDTTTNVNRETCGNLSNVKNEDAAACYDKELCINASNSKKINNIENNHDGADRRVNDMNINYNHEILKSYNLGIGIIGILTYFYFLYK